MAKTMFKAPMPSEVAEYMKEKMKWPDKFCLLYAGKFVDHYMASGWRLSTGVPMKDWQAAFRRYWQKPKWDAVEELDRIMKNEPKQMINGVDRNLEYVENVLLEYVTHPTQVPIERLAGCYDWLKEKKVMLLTKQEIAVIKENYMNDALKGKAACVGMLFTKLYDQRKTVASLIK